MPVLVLGFTGLFLFALAYMFYSRFLAEKVYRLDPNYVTPAHELEDGVEYVPTRKEILMGHHFVSVAGAAPIVGPAIALIWGWAPAFLWVVIGTIFLAICLIRLLMGGMSAEKHLGFEFAAWYWHFVDVVWLFLFAFVYVVPFLVYGG